MDLVDMKYPFWERMVAPAMNDASGIRDTHGRYLPALMCRVHIKKRSPRCVTTPALNNLPIQLIGEIDEKMRVVCVGTVS